jgi:hypothetical protein
MQFTSVLSVAIFGLLNASVFAAPQPAPEAHAVSDPDAHPDHFAGVDEASIKKRGFGCGGPWNEDDMQCHKYVDSATSKVRLLMTS